MTVTRTVPPAKGALRAVLPRGATLAFQYDPAKLLPTGGVGGFNRISRPRLVEAVSYAGTSAYEIPLQLVFDGYPETSVEPQLAQLEAWGMAIPGSEPPVLQLLYAGKDTMRWVINDITYNDEQRRGDGARVQSNLTVTLLEHIGLSDVPGPGDSVRRNTYAPNIVPLGSTSTTVSTGTKYTVHKGDTLSGIAAKLLGKASRWRDIATLNAIRDPATIKPGQVLKIPAK